MATATFTISDANVYELLKLADNFNNDQGPLGFTVDDIPAGLMTTIAAQLLSLYEHKADTFEPFGRQLARWANTSVPTIIAAIAQATNSRLTESGETRDTEDGTVRTIEG